MTFSIFVKVAAAFAKAAAATKAAVRRSAARSAKPATTTTTTTITTITSNGEAATITSNSEAAANSSDDKDTAAASCDSEDTAAASCDGEDSAADSIYGEDTAAASCDGEDTAAASCDGEDTAAASCDGEDTAAASCDDDGDGEEAVISSDAFMAAGVAKKILSLAVRAQRSAAKAQWMFYETARHAGDLAGFTAILYSSAAEKVRTAAGDAEHLCGKIRAACAHIEALHANACDCIEAITTAEEGEDVAAECRRMQATAEEWAGRIVEHMEQLEKDNSFIESIAERYWDTGFDPDLSPGPDFWAKQLRNMAASRQMKKLLASPKTASQTSSVDAS
ncbi:hypothetical protein GGF42_005618 [Coemansia sp. RSA 2424]|nr:hypothetical protein GGF42_005618 [Coemansia sp. RSA 2424]